MINAHSLRLSFGTQAVFDGISFAVDQDQRIGLVGRNGSGKSTLLKVIANQQRLDEGSIAIAKGKRIAYLPQEVILASHQTVMQETFSAFAEIQALEDERLKLEQQFARSSENDAEAVERYAFICEQLQKYDPEQLRPR